MEKQNMEINELRKKYKGRNCEGEIMEKILHLREHMFICIKTNDKM